MAAGRYTSQATSSGRFCCCFLNNPASLAPFVVLPAPCRPTIMTTVGGLGEMLIFALEPPMSLVSSSLTILMTCCAGERLSRISAPVARSVTVLVKSLTTLKLTSASSSASLISRIALLTSASLRRPRLFSFLKAEVIFSERPSNAMISPYSESCLAIWNACSHNSAIFGSW